MLLRRPLSEARTSLSEICYYVLVSSIVRWFHFYCVTRGSKFKWDDALFSAHIYQDWLQGNVFNNTDLFHSTAVEHAIQFPLRLHYNFYFPRNVINGLKSVILFEIKKWALHWNERCVLIGLNTKPPIFMRRGLIQRNQYSTPHPFPHALEDRTS